MPARIYDISQELLSDLPVWPGDPPVSIARWNESRGAIGAGIPIVSQISLGSHAGTHVDAPFHFIPDGMTVDQLPLDTLIGPAWLAYLPGPEPISAARLETTRIPQQGIQRVLFRTSILNTHRPVQDDIPDPALTPDAADWLLAHQIKLVGIDAPSIEAYTPEGNTTLPDPVHRALLGAGVIIVENLVLTAVEPNRLYKLLCLPLRIAGGDAAPARVVLLTEE